MKLVSQSEFITETMGGWPVKANMAAYAGKIFECACGNFHNFSGETNEVLRELPGMTFVLRCPSRKGVTLVKIKGLFTAKIESISGMRD